jgi:hypothetical protein
MLNDFLGLHYRHSDLWAHPYLAGSAVSYQWQSVREPGDLDCLIGINHIQFRKANPEFAGLSDKEISAQLNEEFRENLQLQTENWNGFELTFYALIAEDIRAIKPYAAYDLKYNEWTVTPNPNMQAPSNLEWDKIAVNDADMAEQITTRFNGALQDLQSTRNDPNRRNAENKLTVAAAQGNALYNEIHENRTIAFSSVGEGYGDFNNYRWQAGKRSGAINSLRKIRSYMRNNLQKTNQYGVELPDSSTLVRRAATYRNTL